MSDKFEKVVETFASRKYLRKKHDIGVERVGGLLSLRLDSPVVLARFASVLRQAVQDEQSSAIILCRGQTEHTSDMRPRLFRSKNDAYPVSLLLEAEHLVSDRLRSQGLKRFMRPNLPSLLQHYGINTSWLDVVDNLFVSVWFATHAYDRIQNAYFPTKPHTDGWIYFISTNTSDGRLRVVDLRGAHHHLSVRPHVQHGWSVTREDSSWSGASRGLTEFVVAAARFLQGPAWELNAGMLRQDCLFPSDRYDNTLKVLRRAAINDLLREVEEEKRLPKGSLGSLFQPVSRRDTSNNQLQSDSSKVAASRRLSKSA